MSCIHNSYYIHSIISRLNIFVYDLEDEDATTLCYDDLIGQMECTLGEVDIQSCFIIDFYSKAQTN